MHERAMGALAFICMYVKLAIKCQHTQRIMRAKQTLLAAADIRRRCVEPLHLLRVPARAHVHMCACAYVDACMCMCM